MAERILESVIQTLSVGRIITSLYGIFFNNWNQIEKKNINIAILVYMQCHAISIHKIIVKIPYKSLKR